jgi:phage baseplate assembly protein V
MLSWLYGSVVSAIARGTVTRAVTASKRVFLSLNLLQNEAADVEFVQSFGFSANPAGGEAVLLTVGATRDHKIVIAVDRPDWRINNLAADEFGHSNGRSRIVFRAGSLDIESTDPINAKSDTSITARAPVITAKAATRVVLDTPLVHATGDMTVDGNISDQAGAHGTLATLRADYDGHHHPVHNVQAGGSTINTDVPDAVTP